MSTSKQVAQCENPEQPKVLIPTKQIELSSISKQYAVAGSSGAAVASNSDVYSRGGGTSCRGSGKKKVGAISGTVSSILRRNPADAEKARGKEIMRVVTKPEISNRRSEDVAFSGLDKSNLASSSSNNVHKSFLHALTQTQPAASGRVTSLDAQGVLRSLFDTPKSTKQERVKVSCSNLVKKLYLFSQKVDHSSDMFEKKNHSHAKGKEYGYYRGPANKQQKLGSSNYEKGKNAEQLGYVERAADYYKDARIQTETARQLQKRASKELFNNRNRRFNNLLIIDLRGQQTEKGLRTLKLYLLFGGHVGSVRRFKIITGGTDMEQADMKQLVLDLLKVENIKCDVTSTYTLEIILDEKKIAFGFMDCVEAACASGTDEFEKYLSAQEKICTENQTDKGSSHNTSYSSNTNIDNPITFDLHSQHIEEGLEFLKLHLQFGAYVGSVRHFRVITGYGKQHDENSPLKQSVVDLLRTENIEFKEEDKGTLVIELDEHKKEFSFVE